MPIHIFLCVYYCLLVFTLSHLEVVEDQAGANNVRVHSYKVRLHGVHYHLDSLTL